MDDGLVADWQPLAPALLTIRRVTSCLLAAVVGGASAVVLALFRGPVEAVAALAVVGAGLAGALVAVERRWHAWGWAEREDDLLVRRGVLVQRTSVVPYGRMQFVDVVAGPLARRLGIARVVLHTAAAASDAALPGLPVARARQLRDRLVALGEARQAGL